MHAKDTLSQKGAFNNAMGILSFRGSDLVCFGFGILGKKVKMLHDETIEFAIEESFGYTHLGTLWGEGKE